MSRRKITTLLLTAVFLSCSINVSAAPIDNVEIYEPAGESDEVIFVAGQHQGSQSGEGTTNTENEVDQNIASQNTSLSKEQREIKESIIKDSIEKSMVVYVPGKSIVVKEEIPISAQDILPYITNGLKFEGIPGLLGIQHSEGGNVQQSENTDRALNELREQVAGGQNVGGSVPFTIGSGLTWDYLQSIDTKSWSEDLVAAWERILQNHTWTQFRTDLVGGGMIDWPYQELRYQILKAYVSSLGMTDNIETTNITEYRISKEEQQKIINKQPVGEYEWEIYDTEGNLLKTTHTYGRTLRLSFSRAGTYYIKAYQKHHVTRADVVSTQKLEYWLISETRQLLWSSEGAGKQFIYNRSSGEEFIQTNYIQQEITPSMLQDNWLFDLDSSGQLQIAEGFQVERIK